MNLCWAQGLYDAILYIYNKGMQDYVTPLEDLLRALSQALTTGKQLSDTQVKLGNKLLVYIRCVEPNLYPTYQPSVHGNRLFIQLNLWTVINLLVRRKRGTHILDCFSVLEIVGDHIFNIYKISKAIL